MSYDPQRHHRHSIRLLGYDYTQAGIYFFTTCTHQRECLFGEIVDCQMVLNSVGQHILNEWQELAARYPTVTLDAFVIMPNHVHGIIVLNQFDASDNAPALGQILRVFKSKTAISANRLLGRNQQSLWQRNYFEHIIRNEQVLEKARHYIVTNPERWDNDAENPSQSNVPQAI